MIATDEKRATDRKIMRAPATIVMEDVVPLPAKTLDISLKGMAICFRHKLAVGHMGDISFDVYADGHARTVTCHARVTYCIFSGDSFKVGLQFLAVSPEAARAIGKYMQMHL